MANIEDHIAIYPSQNSRDIQKAIALKQEFREVSGTRSEAVPGRGKKFRHQEAFLRMMRSGFDRILKTDEMGTGKSCTIVGVAQYYKHLPHPRPYRKVIVLENGTPTIHDFTHQVVCNCTDGEYEVGSSRGGGNRSRNVFYNSNLKQWFEITTYRKFVKKYGSKTREQIEQALSGTIIVCDEVHSLRNVKAKAHEAVRQQFSTSTVIEVKLSTKEQREADLSGVVKRDDIMKIYSKLWEIFHIANRTKIMLFTGTPMINSVKDLGSLLNLLLPEDGQIPATLDLEKVTIEDMRPYLTGIVSFVRALDTGINIQHMSHRLNRSIRIDYIDPESVAEEGEKLVATPMELQSQIVVYPIKMSKYQAYYTQQIDDRSGPAAGLRQEKRSFSEFVFPGGVIFGGTPSRLVGEKKTVKIMNDPDRNQVYVESRIPGIYRSTPELNKIIKNPESLYRHSCKFHEILALEETNPGAAFVFTDRVTDGGAILLSLVLEAYDYERFSSTESEFTNVDGRNRGVCGGAGSNRVLKTTCVKRKRYALIVHETATKNNLTPMLELLNSAENANGEYIKIAIGSLVARDGMNLFNVVRIYLMRALWNTSAELQAIFRAIRAISHEALLQILRQKYFAAGLNPGGARRMIVEEYPDLSEQEIEDNLPDVVAAYNKAGLDPSGARVDVKVFRLCAYFVKDDLIGYTPDQDERDDQAAPIRPVAKSRTTIKARALESSHALVPRGGEALPADPKTYTSNDAEMYLNGEKKDFWIRRMARIMKQFAPDGLINRVRNQLPQDVPGSISCDYYQNREYKYITELDDGEDFNPAPQDIDYTTYDILYSESMIQEIAQVLAEYLRTHDMITIQEIRELWVDTGKYRIKFIWMAIDLLVTKREPTIDRFGCKFYINSDRYHVFLQREFPFPGVPANYNLNVYSNMIVGTIQRPLTRIVDELLKSSQMTALESIWETNPKQIHDMAAFKQRIEDLKLNYRVMLLERAIHQQQQHPKQRLIGHVIVECLEAYCYLQVMEPAQDIAAVAKYYSTRPVKLLSAGKRTKSLTKIPIVDDDGTTKGRGRNKSRPVFSGEDHQAVAHLDGTPYRLDEFIDPNDSRPINYVCIHTLYTSEKGLVSYRTTARYRNVNGRIRILNPQEGSMGFRDVSPYEKPVYDELLRGRIRQRLEVFNGVDMFGSIMGDGCFRIHDTSKQRKVRSKKDDRLNSKGEICSDKKVRDLLRVITRERILPPEIAAIQIPTTSRDGRATREEMINLTRAKFKRPWTVFENLEDDEFVILCKWILSRTIRSYICQKIQEHFLESNRMLVT